MPLIPHLFSSLLRRSLLGLALLATASGAFADASGVWKLNLEGPDGRTLASTLTLSAQGDRLTGTINNRAGEAHLSDGSVSGDQVTFTVIREFGRRLRKKTFVSHYTATVKGDTLEGRIQTTDRQGQPRSIPFTATRAASATSAE